MIDSQQCAATQSVRTGQDLCSTSTNHATWIFKKFVYKKHKQSYLGEAFREGSFMIQLFRERLSCRTVKAYATMPKGIMGSSSSPLFDRSSQCFSAMAVESINICLCVLKENYTTKVHVSSTRIL